MPSDDTPADIVAMLARNAEAAATGPDWALSVVVLAVLALVVLLINRTARR